MITKSRGFHTVLCQVVALLIGVTAGVVGPETVWALALPGPLVNSAWLQKNRDSIVILDVRADVESFSKRSKGRSPVNPCGAGIKGKGPAVVAGHIPGAVLVRWSLVTAQKKVAGKKLDGWLPERADFERLMQRSGVNGGSLVVVTGKGEQIIHVAMAARLYVTLKYYGHEKVALLDGGVAAWMQSGGKVAFGRSRSKRGNFKAESGKTSWIATLKDVQGMSPSRSGGGELLDNREAAAYLGLARKMPKVDEKWKGHVPGAKNFPVSYLANSMGPAATLFDIGTIRQVANLIGTDLNRPITLYCNAGVLASLGWFVAHELMGNEQARLYDGSMQEWVGTKQPVTVMKRE